MRPKCFSLAECCAHSTVRIARIAEAAEDGETGIHDTWPHRSHSTETRLVSPRRAEKTGHATEEVLASKMQPSISDALYGQTYHAASRIYDYMLSQCTMLIVVLRVSQVDLTLTVSCLIGWYSCLPVCRKKRPEIDPLCTLSLSAGRCECARLACKSSMTFLVYHEQGGIPMKPSKSKHWLLMSWQLTRE